MGSIIIDVEKLTKIYKNGVKANDNISFKVYQGEIFSILGPNGAGKTTLIKQLVGILKPTSGSIYVAGIDVVKKPSKVKEHISLCPQESAIMGHLTVYEHLYYFGRLKGLSSDRASIEAKELISKFDLEEYANRYVGTLSKGLQRRIIVAQAFIGSSKIVFLDEPTTHLDPVSRRRVWSIIREYNEKGATILLATHYMDESERLSNRVMFLNNGRIVTVGSISDVKKLIGDFIKIKVSLYNSQIIEEFYKMNYVYKINKYSDSYVEIIIPKENKLVKETINFLIDNDVEFELSMPSLEDVFLEVASNENKKNNK